MDLAVAHPVPLTMHHVVADLHVLDDLRDRQSGCPDQPCRRKQREQQDSPTGQFELPLAGDDGADVGGVAFATAGDDRGANRV